MIGRNFVFLAVTICFWALTCCCNIRVVQSSQQDYPDYQDYANDYDGQDNLYQGYAERAEMKAAGG